MEVQDNRSSEQPYIVSVTPEVILAINELDQKVDIQDLRILVSLMLSCYKQIIDHNNIISFRKVDLPDEYHGRINRMLNSFEELIYQLKESPSIPERFWFYFFATLGVAIALSEKFTPRFMLGHKLIQTQYIGLIKKEEIKGHYYPPSVSKGIIVIPEVTFIESFDGYRRYGFILKLGYTEEFLEEISDK